MGHMMGEMVMKGSLHTLWLLVHNHDEGGESFCL